MLPRIEHRDYTYQGENVCSISAVLNIYKDDGVTVVASTGLLATADISQPDFHAEVNRQVNEQVAAYLTKLEELDTLRQQIFPASTDFQTAVDQIFDPIQSAIGG